MVEYDIVKIKDQMGRPENKNFTVQRPSQDLIIESNTLKIYKQNLGDSWIVGSSTNGLVGTNTATEGGGQQVVGASGRDALTDHLWRAVNPDKIYREHFTDTWFKSAVTTADWAVNPEELSMTTGEVARSTSAAYNHGTITKATMTVTITSGNLSDLTLQLTADNSNYEAVTNETVHTFTNTGKNLKWQITAAGTVVISMVRIEYGG